MCTGYFNLRGWNHLENHVEAWSGADDSCLRLIIGMQRAPKDELVAAYGLSRDADEIDNQRAQALRQKVAEDFRRQLTIGAPSNDDEATLRRLSTQLKSRKVRVKLYLENPLHAKLYLLHRPDDPNNPITGFVGSSNLTYAGLVKQGELNVDVLDLDSTAKLQAWFDRCWNNQWAIDISEELAEIIDTSWASERLVPPYHVYLKMAYHLSQEARAGISEFRLPKEFEGLLFDFQVAAVKVAARHLHRRDGVLVGDVVGLGKTLIGTALARIFEDDFSLETLILCPKNLVSMWEEHAHRYRLHAKVMSITEVQNQLPGLQRYRIVLIDESHNLRNREGKRYKVIRDYIEHNDSKCILLSATPYNKTYEDLSNQLRLFVPEDEDIGVRPEAAVRKIGGEAEFLARYQVQTIRSLRAFERSDLADDWRDLMRLYMVRRTRTFIQRNYAETDPLNGRQFLRMADGTLSYFPDRVPKTLKFKVDESDPDDQYARLYSQPVLDAVNHLSLPRYGLANYLTSAAAGTKGATSVDLTRAEQAVIDDLSRAGKRLMGFCRTNLFKRLESGGPAFILSIERHILRNFILLHSIESGADVPVGGQDAEYLEIAASDQDVEGMLVPEDEDEPIVEEAAATAGLHMEADYVKRAQAVYADFAGPNRKRFRWVRSSLFSSALESDLRDDCQALLKIRQLCGEWRPEKDAKLSALQYLVSHAHCTDKLLVFTQYADTVKYLSRELAKLGVTAMEGITGSSSDPTELAKRFSPESNQCRNTVGPERELRVIVSTDVLSEGQNLQDCAIVVNYDLPWAIIRLIQRAGRVDRIGQRHDRILCYSFLPADGIEKIIDLHSRVKKRLQENNEVVGGDESFFEGDVNASFMRDLYTEKAGILDQDEDEDVDLASYAYQIWKNAIDADPALEKSVTSLPEVVYATRSWEPTQQDPEGVLLYMKTSDGNDSLGWIDRQGKAVTQSQLRVLQTANCHPATPAIPRDSQHHELVEEGVKLMNREASSVGGQLGKPSGARYKVYHRLQRYIHLNQGTMFDTPELRRAFEDIFRYPLFQTATDTLNRQLRADIDDQALVELVLTLYQDGQLAKVSEEPEQGEPQIICSLGLFREQAAS